MRISDWSSDVCSSDLQIQALVFARGHPRAVDGDQLAQRLQEVRGRKLGKGQTPGAPLHPPRILVGPEGVDRADRKSVVEGKRVSVRVDLGGRRVSKKKKKETKTK